MNEKTQNIISAKYSVKLCGSQELFISVNTPPLNAYREKQCRQLLK